MFAAVNISLGYNIIYLNTFHNFHRFLGIHFNKITDGMLNLKKNSKRVEYRARIVRTD